MNSNRCAGCGFLNFAAAAVCKRCRAALAPPSDNPYFNSYVANTYGGYQPAPGYVQPTYSSSYFPGAVAPLPRVSKNGGTNAVLLAFVGLALAVAAGIWIVWKIGPGSTASFSWHEYNSEDGAYSIMMPKKPSHIVQNQSSMVGDLKVHMMMADMYDRGAFLVGHTDYPKDFSEASADELLDMSAQGAVDSAGATLLSKKKISLDGHPGVELELSLKKIKGGGRTLMRIYWVAPRRLYIMFASAPAAPDMDAKLTRFLDSLKLRRKQV